MTDTKHRGDAWPIIPGEIPPFFDHPDRACAGKDTNLWFPEADSRTAARAAKICRTCPLVDTCRDWALKQPPQLCGVWGGLTEHDRRDIRAGKTSKAAPTVTFLRPIPSGPKSARAAELRDQIAIFDGAGYSIGAIANRIGCSYRTVQRHLRAIRGVEQVAA